MTVSSPVRSGLPRPLTRFIGREEEIETLTALLRQQDVRLLTLTGPGGIGKTRLAIETGHRLENDADRLVAFVTLSSVTDPEEAISAIAEALGVWNAQREELVERIARILEPQATVLIIDNLEHVIDVAVEVAELLIACPTLTILVTSRIPLHIQGEHEYSVPQLSTPASSEILSPEELAACDAIALFIDRAQATSQAFELSESNATTVAQICQRLDGLPLAIELAAARMKTLPSSALLKLLDNQIGILRSEARDLPPRLSTIRATIDWSYRLLDESGQRVFRRLSVFSGTFSLAGASAVLGLDEWETADALSSLVDNSLLTAARAFGAQPNFRMLSLVRDFGAERLNDEDDPDAVRMKHATFFAGFAEQNYDGQFGPDQSRVLDLLELNHDDIRRALAWAFEARDFVLAARIAAHIWQFWDVRGYLGEGRSWLRGLLDQGVDYPSELIPDLYYGLCILAGSDAHAHENLRLSHELEQMAEENGDPPDARYGKTNSRVIQIPGTGDLRPAGGRVALA